MGKILQKNYIHDYGGKGKTVVLLHGFLASSAYWRRLQPLLSSAGYRVIAIDLLGFGKAPKSDQHLYTYDEHVAHIKESISKLGVTEPFILVGHSMGALLAMRLSRYNASLVEALILLHPPLFASTKQAHEALFATSRFYRFLFTSRPRMMFWGVARLIPVGKMRLRHTKSSRENSFDNIVLAAKGVDDLAHIKTRTLLVLGQKDRKEYIASMHETKLAKSITVKIEPIAHHSPVFNARFICEMISDFVPAAIQT